ncbi:HTH-type transcriptional regulator IdnR [Frankliniella fusca]|uniref:HTH-type transcriptional regulator IdnR n=1 Tax=Frankliniella fusca TaxID=407009 RepID=A0AAE1HEQ9_9NEOP|nr:HTH-type transcriptional regulator IdnR [Frankliniella fusca]
MDIRPAQCYTQGKEKSQLLYSFNIDAIIVSKQFLDHITEMLIGNSATVPFQTVDVSGDIACLCFSFDNNICAFFSKHTFEKGAYYFIILQWIRSEEFMYKGVESVAVRSMNQIEETIFTTHFRVNGL